jgi:peptide deformylase
VDTKNKIKELFERLKVVLEEIPELVFIGETVLRCKTEEVSLEEGVKIGNRLIETLGKYRNLAGFGRGLAAPQIGESKSVFVTFVDDKFKIYLNPQIVAKSDKNNLFRETCLSCGGVSADVKRSESITLKYMNENGEVSEDRYESFVARLVQHEYDHLLGVVNIDIAEEGSIEFALSDPLQEQLRAV